MPINDKKNIIEEVVFQLLFDADKKPPTVRDISRKSGFGIGTIYDYFGSLNDLFIHLLLKKQKSLLNSAKIIIDTHPPEREATELLDALIDQLFAVVTGRNPKMIRFVFHLFLRRENDPEKFNRSIDCLINPLVEAAKRDRTGTIPALAPEQIRLLLRSMQSAIRSPLFEQDPFFGTPRHIQTVKEIGRRLFSL